MLPALKTKTIQVKGIGKLTITEMSARAYVAMQDAKAEGEDQVEVAAIVANHCVPDWRNHTVQEIMDSVTPEVLAQVLVEVTTMFGDDAGKSEAGKVANLS